MQRRVESACRGRAGLPEEPPGFGREPAGGVRLAGLAERAYGAVEQAGERLERHIARAVNVLVRHQRWSASMAMRCSPVRVVTTAAFRSTLLQVIHRVYT
jgi:hypothetical protein